MARGERQAVNAVIQGTVADIINSGLKSLISQDICVIGQIHDEVLVECPESDAQNVAYAVKQALTIVLNGVNLTANVKILQRWGDDA